MANVIQFIVRGVDEVSSTAKKINREWSGLSSGMLAAAGAASAVAGALSALAIKGINTADDMGKLAQKSGTTVEKFSALAFAAEINEVEVGNLGNALRFLNIAMEDSARKAAQGGGALGSLGISLKTAEGRAKDVVDVLLDVADAFAAAKDGAGKVDAAVQLFGRSGRDMIPMLNQGGQAIRGLMDKAAEMGLVVTQRTADMADRFNDDMLILRKSVSAFSLSLAADMLPSLTAAAAGMTQFLRSGGEGNAVIKAIGQVIQWLTAGIIGLSAGFESLGKRIGATAAYLTTLFTEGRTAAGRVWDEFKKDQAEIEARMQKGIKTTLEGIPEDVKRITKSEQEMRIETEAATAMVLSLKQTWLQLSDQQSALLKLQRDQQVAHATATIADAQKRAEALYLIDLTYYEKLRLLGFERSRQLQASFDWEEQEYKAFLDAKFAAEQNLYAATGILTEELQAKKLLDIQLEAARIEEATNNKLLADQYEKAMLLQQEIDFQAARTSLISGYADQTILNELRARQQGLQFQKLTDKEKLASTIQSGQQILAAAAGSNKTLFALHKAFSLAQAAIALPSAVMQSYERAGGYPWGIVPATLMAAVGAAQISKIASSNYSGAAHGGLDYVPKESTYLLDKGERVLSPNQNKDLSEFMEDGGGSINVGEIVVQVAVADAEGLKAMSVSDWREVVAGRVIPALDSLEKMGIRPASAERGRK